MPGPIAGVIEGFYGRPWTWSERAEVMAACHSWGMTHYLYAPKDDPKHRDRWRDPYDRAELDGFAGLVEAGSLAVGFGISPGLSIDYESAEDLETLAAKVDQVLATGVRLVCLALDDIPFGGGPQGKQHAALATWLREHLGDRASLVLVPTEYVGGRPSAYLDSLAAGVPADVPIGWTGPAVVNDAIGAADARARADALGGRAPLLWDNFPVNDGMMAERLHLGPLWGRDAALPGLCSGWLANPMVQPRASLLPLASVAAFLRGDDPLDAWAAEADRRGWRVLAEACDGAVPAALVAGAAEFAAGRAGAAALSAARAWFAAAAAVDAPGLEEECGGWIEQVRAEARVALAALDLVEQAVKGAGDSGGSGGEGGQGGQGAGGAVARAFMLGLSWKALHAAPVSVMGPRLGFQPALGQADDGRWAIRGSFVLEGRNAVDALCRLAFDALTSSA